MAKGRLGLSHGGAWERTSAGLQDLLHSCCGSCSAAAQSRRLLSSGPPAVSAEVLGKARRMSPSVGLLAGSFGSLVGVGGGVIIVPAIVNACKTIPQRLVSGTSLVAVLSTALASAGTYSAAGCVDLTAAALIAPAAMLTAPLGARLTTRLDCQTLRRVLGYFLLAVAPLVPLKAYLLARVDEEREPGAAPAGDAAAAAPEPPPAPSSPPPVAEDGGQAPAPLSLETIKGLIQRQVDATAALGLASVVALVATGAAAGLASGLLGIGGGTLVTPILALLPMPYTQATVVGTSLAAMIPPSAVALVQHSRLGNVDWRMAAGLAVGTAVGGAAGSAAAVQLPRGVLEFAFAAGMFFLGRKTLLAARPR